MKAFEQESLDVAYKEDYKRYLGHSDLYENNLPKPFALIVKNCATQMLIQLNVI